MASISPFIVAVGGAASQACRDDGAVSRAFAQIGPGDLSLSLGYSRFHASFTRWKCRRRDRILTACRKGRAVVGVMLGPAGEADCFARPVVVQNMMGIHSVASLPGTYKTPPLNYRELSSARRFCAYYLNAF
jgi:hypothetical protein